MVCEHGLWSWWRAQTVLTSHLKRDQHAAGFEITGANRKRLYLVHHHRWEENSAVAEITENQKVIMKEKPL